MLHEEWEPIISSCGYNFLRSEGGVRADLALVWCLKPQLSMAAVAVVAVGVAVAAVSGGAPTGSLQNGFAAAVAAAAAALESGCCSAAAAI